MLKQLILNILSFVRKIQWRIDKFCLMETPIDISDYTLTEGDRLLVLAPHADDELIGCHSLITRNITNTSIVYCSFLGSNFDISNQKLRETEFKQYMSAINAASFFITTPSHLIDDLYKIINLIKPTIIALPSYIDWHPEHRKINEILLHHKSIISNARMLWYHLSLPIPGDFINRVIRMDLFHHSQKWQYFSNSYKSQLHIDTARFAFVESLFCRKGIFLESFYEQDFVSWCNSIDRLRNETDSLNNLKNTLGNIENMVNHSAKFYSKLND